ncbi:Rhodanese domain-containing protein [Salinisphaera dokdonensis CL-ES53]|uniref:Rhodanese domain-containing protein n=1 Tax=Salinisphaera dokdonensis CL-ES53 TaxID=1304272 RepID=A0ABV2AWG3_9GAMM
MPITKSASQLVDDARARIVSLTPEEVASQRDLPGVILVDLRDVRERQREGYIRGSMHVPRGMLEFWVDPDSPYHKPELAKAESLILYCNKGWRSALAAATLLDMGLEQVADLDGGFTRWCEDVGEVARD